MTIYKSTRERNRVIVPNFTFISLFVGISKEIHCIYVDLFPRNIILPDVTPKQVWEKNQL